jgi:hypothetical protein
VGSKTNKCLLFIQGVRPFVGILGKRRIRACASVDSARVFEWQQICKSPANDLKTEASMTATGRKMDTQAGGQLGLGRQFAWWATETEIDMAMPQPAPQRATIA